MIAVVVPAHNEAQRIGRCLSAIRRAAQGVRDRPVEIFVTADACSDATPEIARRHGATVSLLDRRCVGEARSRSARIAIERGATWIACTDADSLVPPDWLVHQVSLDAEVVCGTVCLGRSAALTREVRQRYDEGYSQRDDHRHVHGANLGFSASAYVRAGGFDPVRAHEDVLLVERFKALGVSMAWTGKSPVTTSARLRGRAPEGMSVLLAQLVHALPVRSHFEKRAQLACAELAGL